MEGHDYFLDAAGFVRHVDQGEDFWVFPEEAILKPETLPTLQTLMDALQSAEPIQVKTFSR